MTASSSPVDERARTLGRNTVTRARRLTKVFPSYAREDSDVVALLREIATKFGDIYLQDIVSIHAGEKWRSKIKNLIKQAQVFQLFWSGNSAASPQVTEEWQFALSLREKPEDFLQPVYWSMPRHHPVPVELNEFEFAYLDLWRWLPPSSRAETNSQP